MTKGMNTVASNRKQANIAKATTAKADGMSLRSGKLLEKKVRQCRYKNQDGGGLAAD